MHEAISRQLFDETVEGIGSELCASRGWTIYAAAYPVLEIGFAAPERAAVRLRVQCEGWNGQPPSVEWLDADGNPLASIPQGPGAQLNNSAHPQTGRPFVCMAGTREYHTHPSHIGDLWENYMGRSGYDLGGVLTQIWRAWQQARP